ncbi:MAG: hypothetical protein C0486_01490 [Erythrobacter sp.]|nr:hypothetical protein [Erythrobacter sp.]MBA4080302.1 hypothetical protein [Erythrobacter sp.]
MPSSGVFPIFLRAEYRNDGKGFQAFQSEATRAAAAAKAEFRGVSAALDQALSRPRNSSGSLDLGVDELRRAATAQQQVAIAAREVAEATKRAATAAGSFDATMSRATRAAFELANAEERAAAEALQHVAALESVQRELNTTASATSLLTDAQRRGVASSDAQRGAMQNLSFQINDVATQFALGASASQIFASQGGQIIQILQQMAQNSRQSGTAASEASGGLEDFGGTVTDVADRAQGMGGRLGAVAGFLSGPWGLALTSAAVALTPFIGKLLEGEKSADELSEALDGVRFVSSAMGDAQSALGAVMDLTTGRIKDQTAATIALARAQLQTQLVQARLAGIAAETTLKDASKRRVVVPGSRTVQVSAPGAPISINPTAQIPRTARSVSAVVAERALKGDTDGALKEILRLQEAGKTTVEIFGEISEAAGNLGVSRANVAVLENALKALDGDRKALAPFLKPDRGRKDSGAATRRAAREAERLATFGEQAAERIARLNERFDEQPRLIDQASQATRELDALVKELGERKPAGFEELIKDAEKAKAVVESALVRPFEDLRRESQERLQVEQLLAQGREDEAEALQEVIRLERQRGGITAVQRTTVEAIVRAEAERTRFLRDQRAIFDAQLDVIGQVRSDLTAILSGRSTDFFGNFKQALLDLQGQRLFESIFGDAFRDIQNELQKSTPQGRANAAYVQQVERTAQATERVGNSAISLAEEFDRAFDIVRGAAEQTLTGTAANDNFSVDSITVTGDRGHTASGRRNSEVRIARPSVLDLAARISKGIGDSIAVELEDLLGARFAQTLGNIIGGFIGGKAVGGTPGGIIGALRGVLGAFADKDGKLSKTLASIDKALGGALAGTATGTQVAGLSKALGLGGSTTGAQIGGALGSFLPIPGGNIIGAVIGNFVGALFKKTPRASATIGGVGDSLGITSLTGTNASLRNTAGDLGGSVLESINRIAQQLGATVNASAGTVSIGQRKGSLRVDPTGRGITKVGNGAIDFGEDAEAAVAFAVRDLIQDGVITGLRQSEQNLLRAGKDVEAALADVLRFRSVFDQLDEIKDPVGFAVRSLNREFESLIDLFGRAGASSEDLAKLEELYGIRRAEAIEEATSRIAGSLQSLLASLTIGDAGLSLRTRQGNAQAEFDALAARVAAGDSSAFDQFAEVSQQLLEIERQLFGSTQSYFDRLQQVTALTEQAIADQTNVVSIGAGRGSPFDDQASINRTLDNQTAALASRLDAINENLIALNPNSRPAPIGGGGGSGGGFAGDVVARILANF